MTTKQYGTKLIHDHITNEWFVDRWFREIGNGNIVNVRLSIDSDNNVYSNNNFIKKFSNINEARQFVHDYIMKNSNLNKPLGWLPHKGHYESPSWVDTWNGQLKKLIREPLERGVKVSLIKGEEKDGKLVRKPIKDVFFGDFQSANDYIRREYMKNNSYRLF